MNRVYGIFAKALRNRSSKHLILIQGWKPAVRSISNAALKARVSTGDKEATAELARRNKKHEKKQ